MLYHLFDYLEQFNFPGAGVFQYLSFRAGFAFITALLISIFFGKKVIEFLQKKQIGEIIRNLGLEGQMQKKGTPTMGGVIFLLGTIMAFFCVSDGSNKFALVSLVCFLAFAVIGFLDDFLKIKLRRNLGLKPYQKIIGQVAISVIVAIFAYLNSNIGSEIFLPFSTKLIDLGWLYIPFCIFVFLATTNAVNLTDGLDGLAGGVGISFLFGFVGVEFVILRILPIFDGMLIQEYQNVLILSSAVIGSLLSYLIVNSHPASIFMGDTGSLALGGLISAICIVT